MSSDNVLILDTHDGRAFGVKLVAGGDHDLITVSVRQVKPRYGIVLDVELTATVYFVVRLAHAILYIL